MVRFFQMLVCGAVGSEYDNDMSSVIRAMLRPIPQD